MKSDLDLVIAAFEAEKKSLQRMMKQSISEYDYLIAYHHSEALMQLNSQLSTLHSFKDPLYNQREELKRQEKFLKEKPKYFKNDKKMWEFFKDRRLQDLKERKEYLEEKAKRKIVFNDSQQIDDLLFDIVEGKIDQFYIPIAIWDEDVEITFKKEADFLLICVDMFNADEPDFVYDNRTPNPLRGLGFELGADNGSFVYRYDLTNFKDALDIKILLSRLFFDVFTVSQSVEVKYSENLKG